MGSNSSKPAAPVPTMPQSKASDHPTGRESSTNRTTVSLESVDIDLKAQPTSTNESSSTSTTSNGCPMHRGDGTYSYDWWKILSGEFFGQHGPNGPTPLSKEEAEMKVSTSNTSSLATSTTTTETPSKTDGSRSTGSGCPVRQSVGNNNSGCPVKHQQPNPNTGSSNSNPEYNVYGQPIDPSNNMPYNPNQLPSYNQTIPLSTHRVASTIPKGGGTASNQKEGSASASTASNPTTWLYPSPQMFYNALQRKNKLEVDEINDGISTGTKDQSTTTSLLQPEDIESVVAIHNNMNEKTWYKILQWESTIHSDHDNIQPKLLKFQGRPMDMSPKAAIKYYVFGHPLPYDRHDWVIERTNPVNGTTSTQRYVIDYYYDASLGRTDPDSALPELHNRHTGSPSLLVDVRPAIDSFTALYHRAVTMPYAKYIKTSPPTTATTSSSSQSDLKDDPRMEKYEYLPLWPSSTMKSQVNESIQVWQDIQKNSYQSSNSKEMEKETKQAQLSEALQQEMIDQFREAIQTCQKEQIRMNQSCSNDTNNNSECAKASIDLTLCMGSILCPIQHNAFRQTIQTTKNIDNEHESTIIDDALTRLQDCLALKSKQYQKIQKGKKE